MLVADVIPAASGPLSKLQFQWIKLLIYIVTYSYKFHCGAFDKFVISLAAARDRRVISCYISVDSRQGTITRDETPAYSSICTSAYVVYDCIIIVYGT